MVEPEMSRGGRHRNVRICREARGSRVRLSAAKGVEGAVCVCPLYAAIRSCGSSSRHARRTASLHVRG